MFFSKCPLQAIDSLETLMSGPVLMRRGILENLLERANQKKIQQDLEDNAPQPVWQDFFFHSKTLLCIILWLDFLLAGFTMI